MNILSLDSVSKTLKDSPLFQGLSMGIDQGEKIGLVGRNGCGKSTLLRILSGELATDSGSVARMRGLAVSVLEQSPAVSAHLSLRDFLFLADSPLARLSREYEEALAAHDDGQAGRQRLERLHHRMETEGGFGFEHAYASLLSELGLPGPEAPMAGFSGGMAKKAALARCLASGADLVLMDEPTNHLDIDTIEWLEDRLKSPAFALVLVTHDRYFLEAVCARILEIDRGRVHSYPGDYATFLEMRAERYAAAEKADARRVSILRDELEWLRRGPKARGGKSKSRKQRIGDLLDAAPEKEAAMESFGSASVRVGKKILILKDVEKSYGGKKVIEPFSREFSRRERIGVIGPNGSGKSTLLNLVCGRVKPENGLVQPGDSTVFAYFEQDCSDMDGAQTVIEYMREKADRVAMKDGFSLSAEQFLERFLFSRSMFEQRLDSLSGGEARRLKLIRLLSSGANFLLLDEPTNDFDSLTISVLEDFLTGFPGCILAVSHDRAFLDRVCGSLLVLDGSGGVEGFIGDYSDYREAAEARKGQEQAVAAAQRSKGPGAEARQNETAKRKLAFKERKELEGILTEIAALEAERDGLEKQFTEINDAAALAEANRRYGEILPLIEARTARWMELSALE